MHSRTLLNPFRSISTHIFPIFSHPLIFSQQVFHFRRRECRELQQSRTRRMWKAARKTCGKWGKLEKRLAAILAETKSIRGIVSEPSDLSYEEGELTKEAVRVGKAERMRRCVSQSMRVFL